LLVRERSALADPYYYLLFYYENRTQGTLKTIKKNEEQSTTG